ncbi:MAG: hypothetical protein O3A84_11850 [Proteobacteria bacterium]|nr:hypothetical protein [Pseudomonadota bacterium]
MIDATRCYTPPELAKRWKMTPEKVIRLIRSGSLNGFDSSIVPGIGRPRFLIPPEAVADFENDLTRAGKVEKTVRRKRKKIIDLDSI